MTTARDENGIPILGQRDPQQEARAFLDGLVDEKRNLAPDDHDWMVLIGYSLTERDAERAAIAKTTGVAATPPIPIVGETMRHDVGPLCGRCNQMFVDVQATPCPGMSFEDYLASLPEEIRTETLRRMAEQAIPTRTLADDEPSVISDEAIARLIDGNQ